MPTRRVSGPILALLLAPTALVLTHDLVFLLTYGPLYGAALVSTGHDARWSGTAAIVAGVTGVMLLVGLAQLFRLRSTVRGLDDGAVRLELRPLDYLRTFGQLWAAVAILSALLLMGQENVERWLAGMAAPGLGLFAAPGYELAAPILVAVSAAVAAVGALFTWGRDVLVARIAAVSRRRAVRRATAARPAIQPQRPARSLLGRNLAGRAPPAATTA